MTTRLKLENLIFGRADYLQVPVFGKNGCLKTPCQDALLQALLKIYNRFFASQNRRRFREMSPCLWLDFLIQQSPFRGGLISFEEAKKEAYIESYFTSLFQKYIDKKKKL